MNLSASLVLIGFNLSLFFALRSLAALILNLLVVFFWIALFLLISLRVEFLSISFLIIYLGAIAILFIFGLMVVGVRVQVPSVAGRHHWFKRLAAGIAAVFCWDLISTAVEVQAECRLSLLSALNLSTPGLGFGGLGRGSDVLVLGQRLYGDHCLFFWVCGLLLLVAIFGVIAATTPTRSAQGSLNKNV